MGPGDLAKALCGLQIDRHPNLLVGLDKADDAGVYRLTDEIALVQTVDFFTPIVDDPYEFGRIAVANSLSDVYAMGGKPICAMNIVAFPIDNMDISVLQNILRGGLDKLKEAEVSLVGGHSVSDAELKFGLSVSGIVHPDKILTNQGAKPGDVLVLTKPLGTGIINTAVKGEMASSKVIADVTSNMGRLNRAAAEVMQKYEIHACTDVTGFGLVGHLSEMIEGCQLCAVINGESLPHYEEAREYAGYGLLPAGLHRNREHWKDTLKVASNTDEFYVDLVCDPQTSGGLLIAVSEDSCAEMLDEIESRGDLAVVIGEFLEGTDGSLFLE